MKTLHLAIGMAMGVLMATGTYAAPDNPNPLNRNLSNPTGYSTMKTEQTPTSSTMKTAQTAPVATFKVYSVDLITNTGSFFSPKTEQTSGFLVRRFSETAAPTGVEATPKQVSKSKLNPLMLDSGGAKWSAVTMKDLQQADADKDRKITADEAAAAGINIGMLTSGGLTISTLDDKKLAEINIGTGKSITFKDSNGTALKSQLTSVKAPVAAKAAPKAAL